MYLLYYIYDINVIYFMYHLSHITFTCFFLHTFKSTDFFVYIYMYNIYNIYIWIRLAGAHGPLVALQSPGVALLRPSAAGGLGGWLRDAAVHHCAGWGHERRASLNRESLVPHSDVCWFIKIIKPMKTSMNTIVYYSHICHKPESSIVKPFLSQLNAILGAPSVL